MLLHLLELEAMNLDKNGQGSLRIYVVLTRFFPRFLKVHWFYDELFACWNSEKTVDKKMRLGYVNDPCCPIFYVVFVCFSYASLCVCCV